MGKLVNLFRYKKAVQLLDSRGNPAKDQETGEPVIIWIRIIGDEDQQEAYRMSRIRSANERAALRDVNSPRYRDSIAPILTADAEVCIELIKAGRNSQFTSEAIANIERPELPKLEEYAVDADAPSLEEQEKYDAAVRQTDEDYQNALLDYITTKATALDSELQGRDVQILRAEATVATGDAMALSAFLNEVADEKVWRAIYIDKECTIRAVDNIDEFRELHPIVKNQLKNAYDELEMSPEDIKN